MRTMTMNPIFKAESAECLQNCIEKLTGYRPIISGDDMLITESVYIKLKAIHPAYRPLIVDRNMEFFHQEVET